MPKVWGFFGFFFTLHFLIIRRKFIKGDATAAVEEVAKLEIRHLILVLFQ